MGAELLDELDGGAGGAPGGEEVIDEDDAFAGAEGVDVHFANIFAVFEAVGDAVAGEGKFSRFADGDEADTEFVGDDGAEEETSGVDGDDFINLERLDAFEEGIDGEFEEGWVGENRGDVFEENSWFGEIGDIADGVVERGEIERSGHGLRGAG